MKFLNPQTVVAQMGLKSEQVVADFGSGSGYFAVAAAKLVGNKGAVYAIDVQESKLTATFSTASQQGYKNVQVVQADLEKHIDEIPELSCDSVIMASVIHEVGNREALFRNAYRLLKTKGTLLAVTWRVEQTPFGPDVSKRITEHQLVEEMEKIGMRKLKDIHADSFHYAILFEKQ